MRGSARLGIRGDLPIILVATIGSFGAGMLLQGALRVLLMAIGSSLLYITVFLVFSELASGHRVRPSKSRPGLNPGPPDYGSGVLRVMRETLERPRPCSNGPAG